MTATNDQARFVFEEWHRHVLARDAAAVSRLYTDDGEIESPLVTRILDVQDGIVRGRAGIDHFIRQAVRRRPGDAELPSLHRTGTFAFDGHTLIWGYPRATPHGDQLDLVEVMELDGPRIRRHRIYWGWRGTEHIIRDAVAKRASATGRGVARTAAASSGRGSATAPLTSRPGGT